MKRPKDAITYRKLKAGALPPITDDDRTTKRLWDAGYDVDGTRLKDIDKLYEGDACDLGEDIEFKHQLAEKLHWQRSKQPAIRILLRSGKIILFKDYYCQHMITQEQAEFCLNQRWPDKKKTARK